MIEGDTVTLVICAIIIHFINPLFLSQIVYVIVIGNCRTFIMTTDESK